MVTKSTLAALLAACSNVEFKFFLVSATVLSPPPQSRRRLTKEDRLRPRFDNFFSVQFELNYRPLLNKVITENGLLAAPLPSRGVCLSVKGKFEQLKMN